MRKLGFSEGLATGLWIIALLGSVALGFASSDFAAMYRSLNPDAIGAITKLALSPAWYVGAPVVMIGAMGAALVRGPRAAVIGVAAGSVAVVLVWLYAVYSPVFAVAGNIR